MRSYETSQKSKIVICALSENAEDEVGITFGFSLYAISLLVVLVTYFGSRLGDLSRLRLLEDSEICYC